MLNLSTYLNLNRHSLYAYIYMGNRVTYSSPYGILDSQTSDLVDTIRDEIVNQSCQE